MPSTHLLLLVLLYSLLGTISMMVQDFTGTLLVIAEQQNRGKDAKRWDRLGDLAKFVMLCYSGENLMHMGWPGWLGILPIVYFGGLTTEHSTSYAHHLYKTSDQGLTRAPEGPALFRLVRRQLTRKPPIPVPLAETSTPSV